MSTSPAAIQVTVVRLYLSLITTCIPFLQNNNNNNNNNNNKQQQQQQQQQQKKNKKNNSMVVVPFASLLPKSEILFLSLSVTALPSPPSKLA